MTTPITGPVTTRFSQPGFKKPFTWSFSKVKNGEICLKRHYEIDIAKTYKDTSADDPNSPLVIGNLTHDAMRDRLRDKKPLPPEFVSYEFFAKKVEEKLVEPGSTLLVEQKYAITREFKACSYFGPDVWYRGIADAVVLQPLLHPDQERWLALVIDWKTGKLKEDSVQLALMAQTIFSHYPKVIHVASKYYWLAEMAETVETFTRPDMVKFWPNMLTRVAVLENAAATMNYPPTHNPFCKKHCPVVSCPFHGKAMR